MFVNAEVLADTDGQVAALVEAIVANAGARAWDELDELYDDYLNCFFRSLKAWRRGDELGGTHAGGAFVPLSRPAALRRRTTAAAVPRSARRAAREPGTGAGVGGGVPADTLTRVLATGDPTLQQELELRVEALFDSRGIGHQWGPEDGLDSRQGAPVR